MKKLFTFLLALVASMSTAFAYDAEIDGIYYNFHTSFVPPMSFNYTAAVTYSDIDNKYSGSVVIPSSVSYNGTTYSVISIGDEAFYYCSSLTSVTIPNSVKSIGSSAFEGCSSLTSVHITDLAAWCKISFGNYYANPLSSAHNLYLNGELVKDLVIPNSVTSIENYTFSGCSSLTSVTIPNSVKSIGKNAFSGCSSLTSPVYNAHCFAYMPPSYSGAYAIPEGIKQIAGGAFYECSSLTSITIPNSVTSIGEWAFSGGSSLTSVHITDIAAWCNIDFEDYSANPLCYAHKLYLNGELVKDLVIPNSVKSIGSSAFEGCSSLTSVTIPNSVKSIGSSAFEGCSSLTSITIPNSVTSIGEWAFALCSSLTSITIANSVTSIGGWAFCDCSSLTSVTIGNSVTSIGYEAFLNCSSLTSINVDSNNPNYSSVDGVLFSKDKTALIQCPEGKQGAYTIPNSVTSIGSEAFRLCKSLTSVTIPNSVTSIWQGTFEGCSSLTSVTIPNSVTWIGVRAFYGCDKLVDVYCYATTPPVTKVEDTFSQYNAFLYVPCESKKAYMEDAVWGNFKYIECISSEGIEDIQSDEVQSTKVIKDGQVLILRNGKTYTMQGQEVK